VIELRPSIELGRRQLAELFTEAYEGYYVPFRVDEVRLAHMVDSFDLDLRRSAVAFDGDRPVGLANLGLRCERAWLGGVGVVASHRRRGIGELLTRALLDQARAAGARELMLEVIVENAPAIALYEKLGFQTTRVVEVLTLDAAEVTDAQPIEAAEARRRIAATRTDPEPWQRDDATVDNLPDVEALAVDGAVALFRMEGEGVSLLQASGAGRRSSPLFVRAVPCSR